MFVDVAKIHVKAGDGGNGAVAFRREKYVPDGGPDGGNGGKGGHIIFRVDSGMRTLMDFRYKRKYTAQNGQNGQTKNRTGKDGEDLIIKVPPGTLVRDVNSGVVLADLMAQGDQKIIARGGNGGKGNTAFKSSTRRAPTFAQPGFKGVARELELELKMIADVGLIGYPNVGKSTLLSIVSKARPKIGNYHFTTTVPNLGVVETVRGKSYVMADIPGLIEGASQGVGLGHDFLRHIERTRLLVHIVDISASEGRDPIEDFKQINREIADYNEKLAERPMIVVGNKADLVYDDQQLEAFRQYMETEQYDYYIISAITQQNIDQLMLKITERLDQIAPQPLVETMTIEDLEEIEERHDPYEINIEKIDDRYVISGEGIERLMYSTDFDDIESLRYFESYLRRRGVFDRLKALGIAQGETVAIDDYEFEFYD